MNSPMNGFTTIVVICWILTCNSILADNTSPKTKAKDEADKIVQHTKETVSQWRRIATSFKIPREEQEMMSVAFKD